MTAVQVAPSPGVNRVNLSSGPLARGRGVGIHPNVDKSGRWLVTEGCTVSFALHHYKVLSIHDGVCKAAPVGPFGVVRASAGTASFACSDCYRVTLA